MTQEKNNDNSSDQEKLVITTHFEKSFNDLAFNYVIGEDHHLSTSIFDIVINLTPKTAEFPARLNHLINLINNISGMFFIPSVSEANRTFFDGTMNTPSVEMPIPHDDEFGLNEASIILYYKFKAVLNNSCEINELKFIQKRPRDITLSVDCFLLNEENPLIDESYWIHDMNTIIDPETNDTIYIEKHEDNYQSLPWWHRCDGEFRDFFQGAEEDEVVYSYPISIGNETSEYTFSEEDDDDSSNNGGDSNTTIMKLK